MTLNINDLILINKESLSCTLCNNIIEKYERMPNKQYGKTNKGTAFNQKRTIDYKIPVTYDNSADKMEYDLWNDERTCILREIQYNVEEYLTKINNILDYRFCDITTVSVSTLQIQRYEKDIGFFKYHHDEQVNIMNKSKRLLVFIFYLNNVSDGGETQINGDIMIKPETGKLCIFPASWTFPHCGNIPLSSDKYIVTGWIETDAICI